MPLLAGRAARAALPLVLALLGTLSVACQTSGVGDPCIPQAIPAGGFKDGDIVIETTSVMCRTRVCLVYKFTGDPTREIISPTENTCNLDAATQNAISMDASTMPVDPTLDPECQPRSVVRDHIYCSCRCGTSGGNTNVPLCDCPSGFTCTELQRGGGASVEGSYCVRNDNLMP